MNEALLRKWADELYDILESEKPNNLTDDEMYYLWSKVAEMLLIDLANWHWMDAKEKREKK